MKKYLPYVLIIILLVAAGIIFFRGHRARKRVFNDVVTLHRKDKNPYGCYVAYNTLNYIFPDASISTDRSEPGYWDSLRFSSEHQALIIITQQFSPDESEMKKLISLVEDGNDVFISSMKVGFWAEKLIGCDIFYPAMDESFYKGKKDSLRVSVAATGAQPGQAFSYPGRNGGYWFHAIDTATTRVLGYDQAGHANFVQLRAGKGNLFLQLAPLAFSNYFLLHRNNIGYLEAALSKISPETRTVVWDEYFRDRKEEAPRKRNYLSVLMNLENEAGQKSFRAALWLVLLGLLVYTLMEMRRRQRPVPFYGKPGNESLDFVKTIGRLYHDRGDHHNLARKMAAYFLEHVRSRYKLSTTTLDDKFNTALSYKSGVDLQEVTAITHFINHLNNSQRISDQLLVSFHKQLESFYKKA